MRIHLNGKKAIIKASAGDVVYFDSTYWLLGVGKEDKVTNDGKYKLERCFYLTPLITIVCNKNHTEVVQLSGMNSYDYLQKWLSEKQAVIYDGNKSGIELVYKQPE